MVCSLAFSIYQLPHTVNTSPSFAEHTESQELTYPGTSTASLQSLRTLPSIHAVGKRTQRLSSMCEPQLFSISDRMLFFSQLCYPSDDSFLPVSFLQQVDLSSLPLLGAASAPGSYLRIYRDCLCSGLLQNDHASTAAFLLGLYTPHHLVS